MWKTQLNTERATWREQRYHLEQKIANLRREIRRLTQLVPEKPRLVNGRHSPKAVR
jgi:hypothetical protein